MVKMFVRLFLIGLACYFMFKITIEVIDGRLNLAFGGLSQFNNLKTYADKLQFASLYWSASVLLAIIQVLLTISARLHTDSVDPSPWDDERVFRENSILRNFMEQFIISVFSQLCLISTITAKQTFQFIPLMNLFFIVGRILFYLGKFVN